MYFKTVTGSSKFITKYFMSLIFYLRNGRTGLLIPSPLFRTPEWFLWNGICYFDFYSWPLGNMKRATCISDFQLMCSVAGWDWSPLWLPGWAKCFQYQVYGRFVHPIYLQPWLLQVCLQQLRHHICLRLNSFPWLSCTPSCLQSWRTTLKLWCPSLLGTWSSPQGDYLSSMGSGILAQVQLQP